MKGLQRVATAVVAGLLILGLSLGLGGCSQESSSSNPSGPWLPPSDWTLPVTEVYSPNDEGNPELPYNGRVITSEMPGISWNTTDSFDGSIILDFWSKEFDIDPFIVQINSTTGELEWHYTLEGNKLWLGDSQRLPDGNYMFMSENGIYVITPEGECVWFHYAPLVSHHCELTGRGVLVVSAFENYAKEISWEHETLWEWKAEDYIQHYDSDNYIGLRRPRVNIYALTKDGVDVEGYSFSKDWTHMNSAQRLPDGSTILSLRTQDLVLQVDIDGNVIRSWGACILKAQHTPVLDSQGRLWVFDNGNGRVVRFNEYGIAEWEYKGPISKPIEAVGQGGVELINDGEFIIIADGDNRRVLIVETGTKEVVYTLQIELPETGNYCHLSFYRAHYTE